MKIKFLGTNHGMEDGADKRNRQSILVESGSRAYLFDAGAPCVDILKDAGYDISKIKAVFISHSHDDHIHYLPELSECEELKASFYLPDDEQMAAYTKKYDRRYIKICEGSFYNDLFVKVYSVKTRHLIGPEDESLSHAFVIEAEGKRVCITGDLSADLHDFPNVLFSSHTDMILCECSHFSVEELFEKLGECKAERVATVHVYPESKYEALGEKIGKNPFELLLPSDLDEFEI